MIFGESQPLIVQAPDSSLTTGICMIRRRRDSMLEKEKERRHSACLSKQTDSLPGPRVRLQARQAAHRMHTHRSVPVMSRGSFDPQGPATQTRILLYSRRFTSSLVPATLEFLSFTVSFILEGSEIHH